VPLNIVQLPPGPGGKKTGVDDYLLTHTPADLEALVRENASDGHSYIGSHRPGVTTNVADDNLCGRAVTVCLADVASERVRWLWPRRVPLGKVTVLDGDPGLGKSTLALDVAARVTRGQAMPDGARADLGGAAGVVLLSAEDGLEDTIRPRLDAAGADLVRVVALTAVAEAAGGERLPELTRDLAHIEDAIEAVGAVLVVIDPLMAYLGAGINTYRDQDVRRALAPLKALAEDTGVAVVVIRHLNKNGGANALYRGGGSIGIIGAARSGLLVARDPDDPAGERCILVGTKSNLGPPAGALAYRVVQTTEAVARIDWLGESAHTAKTLLTQPESEGERGPGAEAKEFLRDALAEGERPAEDVLSEAQGARIARSTLHRARERLGVRVRREGFGPGGRWLWSLPESQKPHRASPEPIDRHAGGVRTYERDGDLRARVRALAEQCGWPELWVEVWPAACRVGGRDDWMVLTGDEASEGDLAAALGALEREGAREGAF
jgi:hypothetical protein